ncbi:MAG: RsmD family RNA methyltransferase [Candidatus Anammoxibacter sp.]
MRVIAGSARRTPLIAVKGDNTRPILDHIKESLFNIIANLVIDAEIIDLFAGTGGLGIEALSRGAAHCFFVDNNNEAIHAIQTNLKKCRLIDRSSIVETDVFTIDDNQALGRYREGFNVVASGHVKELSNEIKPSCIENETNDNLPEHIDVSSGIELSADTAKDLVQFDVVLVGAPYLLVEQEETRQFLLQLFKRFVAKQIIHPEGTIVLQHKKMQLNITKELYDVEIYDARIYGTTQLTFLRPFTKS